MIYLPEDKRRRIRIGTSGFSYDDWTGPFYPKGLKPNQRLEYYAEHFDTLELNSTYYTLPAVPSLFGMLNKVGSDFEFFIKAHRDLTHTVKNAKATLPKFQGLLKLIRGEGKLGGTLLQFPAAFECTPATEDYLRWLLESLEETRVVVEFRHQRWITDRTLDLLRELHAAYCIVDMPQVRQFPSSRIATTADLAYVRFHGQNREKWAAAATRDERYDYDYSDDQIREWVPTIVNVSTQVNETYVFYNNHYGAKAVKNAKTLVGFLESFQRGSGVERLPIG